MSSLLGMPTPAQMDQLSVTSLFFTIVAYSFVLFAAAEYIGTGSEKLLLLYGSGIVGGLVIPILGAVPDGSMVLFSGLGPCAQVTLNIGIGTLAGSTIMLITVPLAIAIFFGRRDLDPVTGEAEAHPNNRPKFENGFTWTKTGVTTNSSLPIAAKIMMATGSAYLFVLVPALIYRGTNGIASREHYPVLGGIITCLIGFIGYSIYQTVDGNAQQEIAKRQEQTALDNWKRTVGKTMAQNANSYELLFKRADKDGNEKLDREEMANMLQCLGLSATSRQQIFMLMADMEDEDGDPDTVNLSEFTKAMQKWNGTAPGGGEYTALETQPLMENPEELKPQKTDVEVVDSLWDRDGAQEEPIEEFELNLSDFHLTLIAIGHLILGTVLTLVFSGPMVTAIQAFATKTHLNPFFISFFLTPLAGNIAEIYAALMFARKKTVSDISLAISSLYGAACMNNTFVLGVFCTLVFAQKLAWTYTIETIAILLTIAVVGFIGRNKTMNMVDAVIVFMMFPISVILIGALQRTVDGAPIIPAGCPGK